MVGSIVFQFNKDVMRKSFDLYKTMAHEVAGFTKVTGYAVQPYTSAAFKHQLTTGGNPTGFREVTSNRKSTLSLSPVVSYGLIC